MKFLFAGIFSILCIAIGTGLYGMDPDPEHHSVPAMCYETSEMSFNVDTTPEPPSITAYTDCYINETTGERYIYEYTNDGQTESSSVYYVPGNNLTTQPDATSEPSTTTDTVTYDLANMHESGGWSTHESYADSVANSHSQDRYHEEHQQLGGSTSSGNYRSLSKDGALAQQRNGGSGLSRLFPLYSTESCSSIVQRKVGSSGGKAVLQKMQHSIQSKISWVLGKNHPLRKQVVFIDMALKGILVDKLRCIETGELTAARAAYRELREAWPWAHKGSFMARWFGMDEADFMQAIGTDVITRAECALIARDDFQKLYGVDNSWFIEQCQKKQMQGDYHGLCVEHSQLFNILRMQRADGDTLMLRCRIVALQRIMADPVTAAFRTIATDSIDVARQQVQDLTHQVSEYYKNSGTYAMSEAAADMVKRYGFDLITQARICLEARPDYTSELKSMSSVAWEIIIANIEKGPLPLAAQELAGLERQIHTHCIEHNVAPEQQKSYLTKHIGFDVIAAARNAYQSRNDYQPASSPSSASQEVSSAETSSVHIQPVQEIIIAALNSCHDVGSLADHLDALSHNVFNYAERHNYEVHPEIHEHIGISIHTIRMTQEAQAVVFHISYVERVLTDIKTHVQPPQQTLQPTLLERSPQLMMRALEKFVTGLNPITQIKNTLEFWMGTAHFVADVTVGRYYLTSEQYQQRVDGFWQTFEALSPSNLAQLSAEQWVDILGQMAADAVYARGVASTIAYLKEIDAVGKAQRKVSCIADKFKKGLDHIIGKDPIVVTPEGILIRVSDDINELSSVTKSSIKNSEDLLIKGSAVLNKIEQRVDEILNYVKHSLDNLTVNGNKIKTVETNAFKVQHIFFTKERAKGGMILLGKTEEEISMKIIELVKAADSHNLLTEGTRSIMSHLNGYPIEVRVNINNGCLRSINAFPGHSPRNLLNCIRIPNV